MSLYLGFDCSTQSLTALLIEVEGDARRVRFERSLEFDCEFPAFGTRHGVLRRDDAPYVVEAPPLMWAAALDRMMEIVARESGADLSRVAAIAGSAQQHGSVYLLPGATGVLGRLDAREPLVAQLRGIFSRDRSPVWMDSSTSAQCDAITAAVGGASVLANLTGSRAFERFTGPQIRKFFEQDPEGYARTGRIHLVSSYMASLLAGRHARIEPGDGSGMNLLDLSSLQWSAEALQATAPGLAAKLPWVATSWTIVGALAPYWIRRYGFPPAKVVVWSGDNPCTLVGAGLVREGRVGISLGTSDTIFGLMRQPRVDPSGTGHVFGSPTGDFMGLTCFANGSLARQRIAQAHGLDWEGFSGALAATRPGNDGRMMLPWFDPEITPAVSRGGVRRFGLDPGDAASNVRAVVEAQMMSMALHSRWMGVPVETIHATGGAAVNRELLRVTADVFDADVLQVPTRNSACLGAALRAFHADAVSGRRPLSWDEVVSGFAEPLTEQRLHPNAATAAVYADLLPVYAACEAHALGDGPDPTPLIDAFRARHRAP
jgi:xylulokinase